MRDFTLKSPVQTEDDDDSKFSILSMIIFSNNCMENRDFSFPITKSYFPLLTITFLQWSLAGLMFVKAMETYWFQVVWIRM